MNAQRPGTAQLSMPNVNGSTRVHAITAVLGFLISFGAIACESKSQLLAPAPAEVRIHIHGLGIVGPPPVRITYPDPTSSASSRGYLAGVDACITRKMRGVTETSAPLTLAFAIVSCPVGGVADMVETPSEVALGQAYQVVEGVNERVKPGESLRNNVAALLARQTPQYTVELLNAGDHGLPARDVPPDTVLAIENFVVKLLPCAGGEQPAPPLTLYAAVDAALLRAGDRVLLHRTRIEYWSSDSMSFTSWGADQGDRLTRALAASQRSLAEQIVQVFFLADAPIEMRWPACAMPN